MQEQFKRDLPRQLPWAFAPFPVPAPKQPIPESYGLKQAVPSYMVCSICSHAYANAKAFKPHPCSQNNPSPSISTLPPSASPGIHITAGFLLLSSRNPLFTTPALHGKPTRNRRGKQFLPPPHPFLERPPRGTHSLFVTLHPSLSLVIQKTHAISIRHAARQPPIIQRVRLLVLHQRIYLLPTRHARHPRSRIQPAQLGRV